MIQRANLLHYLSEDAYRRICARLKLDADNARGNIAVFRGERISKIELYHIAYQEFGHIWFMDAEVDFPRFVCSYESFGDALYDCYAALLGQELLSDFPRYDELCCSYIEYASVLKLEESASEVLGRLQKKCVPEQLTKELWHAYKKPHGTIEFCACANGAALETLARCHGTALKKRISDPALHRTVGLVPGAAINRETEDKILSWLYKRYNILQ